jgi:DNA polymerase III alpha subunit
VTDIDIDFKNRTDLLSILQHRVAKLPTGKKHNTGVYVTEVPHNPVDLLSTVEYKDAAARGYLKLDFLNVNVYKDVRDEAHLVGLTKQEPIWELLTYDEFVDQVFQLSGHGNIVRQNPPTNLDQLAALLALIRPAKKHLIGKSWDVIMKDIWVKPTDGAYYFKKAHAYSYALLVVVHMNVLCEKLQSTKA